MADDRQGNRREGREGNRWINQRPSGEDVAKWFKENVDLHEGLEPDDYVQGVTMIQQTERSKEVVGWNSEGQPVIADRSNIVFTPYVKVETRVKYFHDLMAHHADEWLGVIEPVIVEKPSPELPPGFFKYEVAVGDKAVRFICCSMKVTVYKRDTVDQKRYEIGAGHQRREVVETAGETLIDAPPATKIIPTVTRGYQGAANADSNALMKAETGAVGRALALAGMLVIPGSGVASAEDMAEALDDRPAATPEQAEAPAEQQEVAWKELRDEAKQFIIALRDGHPEVFKDFQDWAKGRGFGKVDDVPEGPELRGLHAKAKRMLDEAGQP